MAKLSEDVELLISLGLAVNEAKVFLALAQLGESMAKAIAKSSGVAREVVYQIMPKLREKGLVEEAVALPKKFRAVPIEDAFAVLLQRKEEENRSLCRKVREALKRHQSKTALKAEDDEIILVPAGGPRQFRISQEYENAQKSVDLTFPFGKFLQWSQYYAEWGINEAMKRNVEMRIITEQQLPKMLAAHPEFFSHSLLSKLGYVNLKYAQSPLSVELMIFDKQTNFRSCTYYDHYSLSVELMIFDKQTAFISIKKESNINKMLWLLTSNPFIVELANSYFETTWQKATKETMPL